MMTKTATALCIILSYPMMALAGGHSQCAKCHEDDEFDDFSATEIVDALGDSSIKQHAELGLNDEQVQAIAAELADD